MKALTFKGGVHPLHSVHEGKDGTKGVPIREFVPSMVVASMAQNIGAPCEPVVKKGDAVCVGQMIGKPLGFVSAPVHASVSGIVVAVEPRAHVTGTAVMSVVIESDGLFTPAEGIAPYPPLSQLSAADLRKIALDIGLVGEGGATFPTHVKLAVKPETVIDYVIANGAECEPFLTCDHRTMLERSGDVILGVQAFMKAVNCKRGVIGIEENKPDAIESMQKAVSGIDGLEVAVLVTKYPQGGEKQLIFAITGREVPIGALPSAVGCVVCNVGTCAEMGQSLRTGMPCVRRILTVTGDVAAPANLIVPVGTSFQDCIDACDGFKGEPRRILSGGPMMGFPCFRTDIAVTKGTSGITVFNQVNEKHIQEGNCLHCGRCVDACPMGLAPQAINAAYLRKRIDLCERYYAANCISCGCCTFACPARRHLSQSVDLAKREIAAKARRG